MNRRTIPGYVVRSDKTDGPVGLVLSTPETARDGMKIPVKAWDVEAFRTNPLLMWSHDYSRPPIGRIAKLQAKERGLIGEAIFDEKDAFAGDIARKVRAGFINACSVGFFIHEMEPDGRTAKRVELYEVSLVAVPSDPRALVEARTAFRSLAASTPEDATRAFLERLAGVDDTPTPEEHLHEILRPLTLRQRRAIDDLEARNWTF